jgi:hypothetical protein
MRLWSSGQGCYSTWESPQQSEYKQRICLSRVLFHFLPRLHKIHSEKLNHFSIWEPYRCDYVELCRLGCNTCSLLLGGFLLVLLFDLENVGITFLRNVSKPLPDYIVLVQERNAGVWKQVFHQMSIRKNTNKGIKWTKDEITYEELQSAVFAYVIILIVQAGRRKAHLLLSRLLIFWLWSLWRWHM